MRRLTFGMNLSLDGYIAAPGDDLGWSVPSDELFQWWSDRVGATGLALYGRKLWETMSSHWPTADQQPGATPAQIEFARRWRDMPKVVFSSTTSTVDWNTRLVTGDAVTEITRLKAEEQGHRTGVEEEIPASLPALARAGKVQRRAAGWGFEWRSFEGAIEALREEVEELAGATDDANAEEEIGDVLFAAVAVARKLGLDAESALRRTTRVFAERYERFTELAAERGLDVERMSEEEVRELFREARGR